MKERGFTLIELLAVIVILAIIALIATPIILGIINDSKEQANQRSVEMYAVAIKNALVSYQLNKKEKTTSFQEIEQYIEYDGNIVCNTIEIYEDGNVYLDKCIVNNSEKEYSYGIKQSYNNGQEVYFDVYNGVGCTEEDYHEDNSKTGYNGYTNKDSSNNETEKLSTQNSCLKFYAFLDDGGNILNLILDHNTTAKLAWNSSGNNSSGPKEVFEQLKTDTKEWNGTETLENYEYKGNTNTYIVHYNTEEYKYKARLITANEVAQITGADKEDTLSWNEKNSTNMYFFDSFLTTQSDTCKSGNTTGCKYGWLYDRTAANCTTYGCLNKSDLSTEGYWTSSAHTNNSNIAWYVRYTGCVNNNGVSAANSFGVRPVIEVSKSKLS